MWAYEVSGKQVLWHWFSAQGDEHSGCIPAKYGRVRDVGKARRRHRSGPHSIRATIISAARVFSSGHRSAQASVKAPMSPWSRITGITPLHVRRAKNGSPSVHPMQGEEIRALRSLQREQGPSSHVFMTERDGPMTPKAFHALFGWIGARATHFIGGAGHAGGVRTRLFRHSRARMFSGCGSLQQPPGFQFLVPLLVYKSTSLCL